MSTVSLFGQDVEVTLDEGDVVLESMLLLRTVSAESSRPAMVIAITDGIDATLQIGMLEMARDITRRHEE